MRRLSLLLLGCLAVCTLCVRGVEFVTSDTMWDFCGEEVRGGKVSCEIAQAPEAPDRMSMKLTFRKQESYMQWLDVMYRPTPIQDWTNEEYVEFDYYTNQEFNLMIKITGENNPGANKAVIEHLILIDGKSPAPGKWHRLKMPLPKDPKLKNTVDMISVYVNMNDPKFSENKDYVCYIGKMEFKLKPRPVWPPQGKDIAGNFTTIWEGPIDEKSPWLKVGGPDNQNKHLASFKDGAIYFESKAEGWNEFAWSDVKRLRLKNNVTYLMTFDYQVTENLSGKNAMFYSLVRCAETITRDVGWQRWHGSAGNRGKRSVIFKTTEMPDYRVIFGIRDCGGIAISNVVISEMGTAKQ